MRLIGDGIAEAEPDTRDDEIARLTSEVRRLRGALQDAEREAVRAQQDAERAVANLRRQLSPLYRALQMVFGEIETIAGREGAEAQSSPVSANPRVAQVWDEWKTKIGRDSAPSRVIDALLVHGSLNVPQLKVAAKMATQTVYDATHKLNKLGLINKNGGRYSLKEL